jgi:hypothetical protein
VFRPQVVDQLLARDDPPGPHQQRGQQRALPTPAELDSGAVPPRLDLAEQPELDQNRTPRRYAPWRSVELGVSAVAMARS